MPAVWHGNGGGDHERALDTGTRDDDPPRARQHRQLGRIDPRKDRAQHAADWIEEAAHAGRNWHNAVVEKIARCLSTGRFAG